MLHDGLHAALTNVVAQLMPFCDQRMLSLVHMLLATGVCQSPAELCQPQPNRLFFECLPAFLVYTAWVSKVLMGWIVHRG